MSQEQVEVVRRTFERSNAGEHCEAWDMVGGADC